MPEQHLFKLQPKQAEFLGSSADLTIFGGTAGCGKSWSLLAEPLRHATTVEGFGSVCFRRNFSQVIHEGGLWDESSTLYAPFGAQSNRSELTWRFPSGASVSFGHLQHEDSVRDYDGSQICLLLFDELSSFSEKQFFAMLARNRSVCGIRPYLRATTNPAGPGHWLTRFLGWWIGEDGFPIPERSGLLRYFVRSGNDLDWDSSYEGLVQRHGPDSRPKSVSFVPGKLSDNPALTSRDPGYLANLLALPRVERERLLDGNWLVTPQAGAIFDRSLFPIVNAVPAGGVEVLFWDFASTAKQLKKNDPDFTACVAIRRAQGRYFVSFMDAVQAGPAEVERRFQNLSRQRAAQCKQENTRFLARWEQEPGSAGKREAPRYTALLAGLDAKAVPPRGDKILRCRPLAAQCDAGNVSVLAAPWTERFLSALHEFPDASHDDIPDAASGAFSELAATQIEPRQARSYQG